MQCSICETAVSEHALFCEVCGNRVRREPVTVRRPAATPAASRYASSAAARSMAPPAPPIAQREELAAAVQTRAELGERMEPEVLDAFLARIEQAVIARVDQQVDLRMRGVVRGRSRERHSSSVGLPVAICSLIFGIPLSAIAAAAGDLPGLVVAWLGIAAVNVAVNAGRKD
jgi:hypothetical protein